MQKPRITMYLSLENQERLKTLAKELEVTTGELVAKFLDNFDKFKIADAVCYDDSEAISNK